VKVIDQRDDQRVVEDGQIAVGWIAYGDYSHAGAERARDPRG
jgi:hypothetical protein